jgi:hypothetical protein
MKKWVYNLMRLHSRQVFWRGRDEQKRREFYNNYGALTFRKNRVFEWKIGKKNGDDFYFLKMKI